MYCIVCGHGCDLENRIYIHSFPKSPLRRAEWSRILFDTEKPYSKLTRICSRHFSRKAFVGHRLSRNAYPLPWDTASSDAKYDCKKKLKVPVDVVNAIEVVNPSNIKKESGRSKQQQAEPILPTSDISNFNVLILDFNDPAAQLTSELSKEIGMDYLRVGCKLTKVTLFIRRENITNQSQILSLLAAQNVAFAVDSWHLLHKTQLGNGIFLVFGVPPEELELLKKNDLKLHYKFQYLTVKVTADELYVMKIIHTT
ncbi:uncharacterized protein [Atheta coriaria]|uniref:uncharacterized protein n=1 Tax=Dalotia coriaria TaxID=877792 RepID=UPI0031F43751